jgi:hypothetical protein
VLLFLDREDSAALSMHNTKSFNDDGRRVFGESEGRSFLGFRVVGIKP